MNIVAVFFEYLDWHYRAGIVELLRLWGNIHWFFHNFFSVPILVRPFFTPFHRLQEKYARGPQIERFFEPASPVKDTQSSVERNADLCDPGFTQRKFFIVIEYIYSWSPVKCRLCGLFFFRFSIELVYKPHAQMSSAQGKCPVVREKGRITNFLPYFTIQYRVSS